MTNKQIIIDGCNVSGCEYFKINRGFNCYKKHNCNDKECYNCYYKQLKRTESELACKEQRIVELNKTIQAKEQECEELKERLYVQAKEKVKYIFELDQLKVENNELKKIIERLDVPTLEVIDMDIAFENEKLKAENEILKEKLVISSNSDKKTLKIIQTLTDIKEIIEQGVKIHDDIIVSKQILQKINECEVNNEK